ncbi:hypothetical protein SAMN05444008_114120 [Cnuella takakiae]|uniref:Uncharacterized protein n=1 Tax=Cnuella takakiae TaxID=1302690 RepID=A0A1M5FR14_9BACT|nr:hypothetical protein [Cnuella takakiae]OLY93667.1 hypothetical protein BUE76_18610 [Cnuella takakiae]SHF93948.1 hypothetical protein SAMN05444008_114120 [Cnuella takakiae]
MERVFTTHFEFNGKTYTTHVRQLSARREVAFQAEVPDESLLYLLPDGKVVYSSRSGLEISRATDDLQSHELVGAIIRSVEPHLV